MHVLKLNHCYSQFIVIVIDDVTGKSREQRLITKEHIATHAFLILLALYSSTLVLKVVSSRNSYCKTVGWYSFITLTTLISHMARPFLKLKCSVFSVLYSCLLMINEWLIQHYASLLRQKLTTCFVTKATPIDLIDGKCYIKKLKSSRTCITAYSAFISRK